MISNTKPDITACLGAWYTWDRILQTGLEAPDTCLKSLHHVIDTPKVQVHFGVKLRLWSILELKGHFTRADYLEVDERKNNRSMRISAGDRYQEIPRQMKINIDRCTQVPSIDVETPDATFWIQQT
ncbi:hypothetical protein F2Q69_00038248 [Brassica cretica]|uniref:Uncharacterized protein n=1 Tax=Brassica cretica TaxID=69181 RepID=A0A8S9SPH7_BRACR|nr:hypothetical protein F2Q69_00038248 [Brassica cretica]